MATSSRNAGIDLLRSFAVILVLFHHLDVCGAVPNFLGSNVLHHFMLGGWVGVDCFFVLSGFLVSGLLFREHSKSGGIRAGRFLIRRGLKIYPAFYCMLAVTVAVYVVGKRPFDGQDLLGEILFLQNYVGNLWRHTWSLAVEEHFYLLLVPVLVGVFALCRGQKASRLCFILGGIYLLAAVVCLVLRIERVGSVSEFSAKIHQFPTHLRIDSLFLGVFLCSLRQVHPVKFDLVSDKLWKRWGFGLLGSLCFLPAFFSDIAENPWLWSWGYLIFSWGAACLLLAVLPIQSAGSKVGACLASMGTYSYSIYLWHMMAGGWVATRIQAAAGGSWFVGALAYFILSIGVGVVMSKLIEWPVLRLRDRYFPSRTKGMSL